MIRVVSLKLIKFFNTISFTAKPINGGTPPRLKNCKATSNFLVLSLIARSLNLLILLVIILVTALTNIREYMIKNKLHILPIKAASIHIPFPTEERNNMYWSDKFLFKLMMMKEALISIKPNNKFSLIPNWDMISKGMNF